MERNGYCIGVCYSESSCKWCIHTCPYFLYCFSYTWCEHDYFIMIYFLRRGCLWQMLFWKCSAIFCQYKIILNFDVNSSVIISRSSCYMIMWQYCMGHWQERQNTAYHYHLASIICADIVIGENKTKMETPSSSLRSRGTDCVGPTLWHDDDMMSKRLCVCTVLKSRMLFMNFSIFSHLRNIFVANVEWWVYTEETSGIHDNIYELWKCSMRRTHPPICSLLLTLHLLSSLIPTLSTVFFLLFSGYIGEFEIVDDHRSGKIVVNLTGRLNKCGVISPRFDVPINDIEKWTNNLLPSRQFGYVLTVLSI